MDGGGRSGSKTSGTNHPSGVITYFNVENITEKDSISLTYFDTKGDTIQVFSNTSDKYKLKVENGLNQFTWDMIYKGAEKLDGMILWWASLNGPKAVPGSYKVTLKVNDDSQTQNFEILPDPRSESTIADMQKQFDFITDVNKTMDDAHQSIKKIRYIKSQLLAFEKQYKGDERVSNLLEKSKKLREQFTEIEEALYQTKNRSGQDPLNFPIRLTNKLGHLNALVSMGDFAPTDQDVAVKNQLTQEIEVQLTQFNKLVSDEISAFNSAFNDKQLNYLFIEK